MEFKEICACMHAYAEAAGAGPLSLPLSLSTRSPKSLIPFGQGGSVFFPFSFCQHKGRRDSKSVLPLFTKELIT